MVRREGTRRGARGDGVQHGGFYFDEVCGPAPLTNRAYNLTAPLQVGAGALIRPQVRLAVTVAKVVVGDAGPLVTKVVQRLGEPRPLGNLHRELAALGAHNLAGDAHPVTEVQISESREILSNRLEGEELNLARRVAHRRKGQLALGPHQHDAAGHLNDHPRFLAVGEVGVGGLEGLREGVVIETIRRTHGVLSSDSVRAQFEVRGALTTVQRAQRAW